MSKPIPAIKSYMTASPHTIGADQTLAHAHAVMREHGVRHLPVLEAGQLVGMLTERDLALVEALKDVEPSTVIVSDAMNQAVYTVTPNAPIDQVVAQMALRKLGSAVVMDHGKVAGIFTTVDVCTAFAELLHGRVSG